MAMKLIHELSPFIVGLYVGSTHQMLAIIMAITF